MVEENVTHFSHPMHPLGKVRSPESFTCDGCKTEGSGHMYWCESCDFKLHTFCATAAASFTFFMHPDHRVALVDVGRAARVPHRCDVCNGQPLAMAYRCAACDFDVHPACALLPPTVRDEVHPDHVLTFIESGRRPCTFCATAAASFTFFMHPDHRVALVDVGRAARVPHRCDVCNGQPLAMAYRCAACDFDVHPACALLPPTVRDEVHPDHVLTFIESGRRPCTGCGSECSGGRYRCDPCQVDYHPKCLRRDVLAKET